MKRWNTLALVVALCGASPFVSAHAVLKEAVPSAGSVLHATPKEVALTFNEKIEGAFSAISLTDPKGKPVATGKAHLDPENAATLQLALPTLPPGEYGVHWTVVGRDGHRRKGEYTFTVR